MFLWCHGAMRQIWIMCRVLKIKKMLVYAYGSKVERKARSWCIRILIRHRRSFFLAAAASFLISLVLFCIFPPVQEQEENKEQLYHPTPRVLPPVVKTSLKRFDKWVVVTASRDHPTPSLYALANEPAWKLLVVAENERVSKQDWGIPGSIFLDRKGQEGLPYNIVQLLPASGPSRRLLGFLYAILHGAEYIYEIDGGLSIVNVSTLLNLFDTETEQSNYLMATKPTQSCLTYHHFGLTASLPWDDASDNHDLGFDSRKFGLCKTWPPSIQYSLVNIKVDDTSGVIKSDVTFDGVAPALLHLGDEFCGYTGPNALYRAEAWWSLLLPVSLPFPLDEVYRFYITQKVIKSVGQTIAFFPPSGYMNATDWYKWLPSYQDGRRQKYLDKFLYSLKRFTCKKASVYGCLQDVYQHLEYGGFLHSSDVEFLQAWLGDLSSMNYNPPLYNDSPLQCDTKGVNPKFGKPDITFFPTPMPFADAPNTQKSGLEKNPVALTVNSKVQAICHKINLPNHKKDFDIGKPFIESRLYASRTQTLLIIHIHGTETLPLIEAWYRPYFPNILYCGPLTQDYAAREWNVSYIGLREHNPMNCLLGALQINYNVRDYLFMPDNALLLTGSASKKMVGDYFTSKYLRLSGQAELTKCQSTHYSHQHCIQVESKLHKVLNTTFPVEGMGLAKEPILRFPLCLQKILGDSIKATYLSEFAIYLPVEVKIPFVRMHNLFLEKKAMLSIVEMALLFECLERSKDTFNHLPLPSERDTKNPDLREPDYIWPFDWSGILNQHTAITAFWCDQLYKENKNGIVS